MDRFIERQNIAHYVDQLKTQTDPIKRAMLQKLLAEEKIKQASHEQRRNVNRGRPTEISGAFRPYRSRTSCRSSRTRRARRR